MMDERERRNIMARAIQHFGETAQIDMAVEEIADVQIMLDQLRLIFARSTDEIEEDKLRRLLARINSWKESKLRRWLCEQEHEAADEVLRVAKEEGGAPDE